MPSGTALLVGFLLAAGGADADVHLVAGADHFRAGRYAEALVEFRVAERLGAEDARPYAGAALVKLGRPEDALEAFGGDRAPSRDALLDYYHALACHDARLYRCADRLLAGVGDRSGPRIAEQAAKIRARLAPVLAAEPLAAAIDGYLDRCQAARDAGRRALAGAFCREAAAAAERRRDRYRLEDARRAAAALDGAAALGGTP